MNTGQTTNVRVPLSVASIAETVTVTGQSPSVDPTSATLGFNYTPQLLENVPTTRNFHNIVTTIPGVETAAPYGVSPGNLENESVLGAGPFSNRYNLDGANITDPAIANNQANLFNITNASTVLQVGSRSGVDLGAPRFVRNPRIVRFGAMLSW